MTLIFKKERCLITLALRVAISFSTNSSNQDTASSYLRGRAITNSSQRCCSSTSEVLVVAPPRQLRETLEAQVVKCQMGVLRPLFKGSWGIN